MTTTYAGFQSYVSSAPSPTSPYGRFIAGGAADDGDLDDAQHLMALAIASMDSIQWLGWRVGYLNVVEGSAGNAALTATISNYNAWNVHGNWAFSGTLTSFSGTNVIMDSEFYVVGNHIAHVGDPTLGIGTLVVNGAGAGFGSTAQFKNGGHIIVDGSGTVTDVRLQNGAALTTDAASSSVHSGSTTRLGAAAYSAGRAELTAPNATGIINCNASETFAVPVNMAANVVLTLSGAPGIDVTFYTGPSDSLAHNFSIKIAGATANVVGWGAPVTQYTSITLRNTGTRWIVICTVNEGANFVVDYSANAIP